MALNRRDLLLLAGGTAAGSLLTPLPWKLLDDTSIWTQNWSWTPRLSHGEVSTRYGTCTLCPQACGVRVRTVEGRPFALAGIAEHPEGCGALCPAGVIAHHVAYHPARVRQVLHRQRPAGIEQAIEAVRAAKGSIAVFDQRPGRAISELYRRFAAAPHGIYLTPAAREGATLAALRKLSDATEPFGIDLEHTAFILSFGAPVLDGWGAPGRVWKARDSFRLVQAETRQSRTAELADTWLAIHPGSEAALALGIANILLQDGLADAGATRSADFAQYRAMLERFTPDVASRVTGVPIDRLRSLARDFASAKPAIAIGGGDPGGGPLGESAELAIAGLNLLVGSAGRRGGMVARHELFETRGTELAEVADASIGALIIDGAPASNLMPWETIRRKLRSDAVVVSLSAFPEGLATHADYVIPAPAPFEALEDATAPFDAPRAMYTLAPALLSAPEGVMQPTAFLTKLAAATGLTSPGDPEAVMHERVAAIHKLQRGEVLSYATGERTPLAKIASADDLWKALAEGACWIDEEAADAAPRDIHLLARGFNVNEALPADRPAAYPLAILPHGWQSAVAGAPSPLMTKLYQESNLRPPANEAAMHPATARAAGLADGNTAVVETSCGTCRARVRIVESVAPGVIDATVAPCRGVLDMCDAKDDTWRDSNARIRRA